MIAADKPVEQRVAENNMRVLASVLHDKVDVKGSRITKKGELGEGPSTDENREH